MGSLSAPLHNDEGGDASPRHRRQHRRWCRNLRDGAAEGHRHLQLQKQMLGEEECGHLCSGYGKGQEGVQMEPTFDFPGPGNGPQNPFLWLNNNPFDKTKRKTTREPNKALLDVDEDDFYEYLKQVKDFRHLKRNSMGNLTCVLQKIGQLTEDMEVNMEYYTTALTAENAEFGFTWDVEGSAAIDPEWRAKIAREYNDCYETAQSLPAISLSRNHITRMFGRQKFFFNCADRTERRVCTEAQLVANLEAFYGSESDEETAERIASVGLPENKYDAAAISLAVLQNAKSEEEQFVDRFLWDIDGDNF